MLALKATTAETQPQLKIQPVSGASLKMELLVISGSIAILREQQLNQLQQQQQPQENPFKSNCQKLSKLHHTVETGSQLTTLLFQVVAHSLIPIKELACGGKPRSVVAIIGYEESVFSIERTAAAQDWQALAFLSEHNSAEPLRTTQEMGNGMR
jgi:hypothetical protein